MLSCNDILSPPLWVLPLVHSPQYLSHLWDLAEEAREVDLSFLYTEQDTQSSLCVAVLFCATQYNTTEYNAMLYNAILCHAMLSIPSPSEVHNLMFNIKLFIPPF